MTQGEEPGKLGEILSPREKLSGSASIWVDTSEIMMFGLGMGGACSRCGDDGRAEEGLGVDDEGCEGLSGRSRGVAEL